MVRNASCSPAHPLSHRPCFREGLWLEMNSPSMTQLGKGSSNLSTSFWQTRLERNRQVVPPGHALTSMTCFTRLPEDTALSKDGWIPSTESKWEMMASERWWQDILLDPLSRDAYQQSATVSSVSLCCVFSNSVSSEDRARGNGIKLGALIFQREEGITRSHFKFLWRVSEQLIPSPDSGAITSGCPPYFCTRNQSSQSAVKFGWKEKMFLNLSLFFFSSPVRQRLRREGGLGGRRREQENFWMINTFNCTCASAEGWRKAAGERWDPQIINIKDERTSEVICYNLLYFTNGASQWCSW